MSSLDIIRSRDNRPYLKLLISSCSLSCVVPPCIQVRNMMPEASYFSMLNCCISVRSLKPFARDPEVTQYFISALVASFWGTLKTKAFILLSPFSVASNPFSISFILLNNSLSCVESASGFIEAKALPSSFINCNTFEINERALSESNRSRSPKYKLNIPVGFSSYWFSRFTYSRPLLSWNERMFKNCVRLGHFRGTIRPVERKLCCL